jgi:hypothetical protein
MALGIYSAHRFSTHGAYRVDIGVMAYVTMCFFSWVKSGWSRRMPYITITEYRSTLFWQHPFESWCLASGSQILEPLGFDIGCTYSTTACSQSRSNGFRVRRKLAVKEMDAHAVDFFHVSESQGTRLLSRYAGCWVIDRTQSNFRTVVNWRSSVILGVRAVPEGTPSIFRPYR